MKLSSYVAALSDDLTRLAALGDEQTAEAGRRLAAALDAAAERRLLEALGEVARELSGQPGSGRVELRLAGDDVRLVHVEEEPAAAAPADDAQTARITLRLSEALKEAVEAVAAHAGVSVNAWIVQTLGRTAESRRRAGSHLRGYAQG